MPGTALGCGSGLHSRGILQPWGRPPELRCVIWVGRGQDRAGAHLGCTWQRGEAWGGAAGREGACGHVRFLAPPSAQAGRGWEGGARGCAGTGSWRGQPGWAGVQVSLFPAPLPGALPWGPCHIPFGVTKAGLGTPLLGASYAQITHPADWVGCRGCSRRPFSPPAPLLRFPRPAPRSQFSLRRQSQSLLPLPALWEAPCSEATKPL